MPCSPHQRMRSRSRSSSIENSCWSESTWRMASAALDQISVEVRDPDEPHEAVVHQGRHRCPRLLDRDAGSRPASGADTGRGARCRVAAGSPRRPLGPVRRGSPTRRARERPWRRAGPRRGDPPPPYRRAPPTCPGRRPRPCRSSRCRSRTRYGWRSAPGPRGVARPHSEPPPASQAPNPITDSSGPCEPNLRSRIASLLSPLAIVVGSPQSSVSTCPVSGCAVR